MRVNKKSRPSPIDKTASSDSGSDIQMRLGSPPSRCVGVSRLDVLAPRGWQGERETRPDTLGRRLRGCGRYIHCRMPTASSVRHLDVEQLHGAHVTRRGAMWERDLPAVQALYRGPPSRGRGRRRMHASVDPGTSPGCQCGHPASLAATRAIRSPW